MALQTHDKYFPVASVTIAVFLSKTCRVSSVHMSVSPSHVYTVLAPWMKW